MSVVGKPFSTSNFPIRMKIKVEANGIVLAADKATPVSYNFSFHRTTYSRILTDMSNKKAAPGGAASRFRSICTTLLISWGHLIAVFGVAGCSSDLGSTCGTEGDGRGPGLFDLRCGSRCGECYCT
jgi:hypothetical protein